MAHGQDNSCLSLPLWCRLRLRSRSPSLCHPRYCLAILRPLPRQARARVYSRLSDLWRASDAASRHDEGLMLRCVIQYKRSVLYKDLRQQRQAIQGRKISLDKPSNVLVGGVARFLTENEPVSQSWRCGRMQCRRPPKDQSWRVTGAWMLWPGDWMLVGSPSPGGIRRLGCHSSGGDVLAMDHISTGRMTRY